jgi:ribonuclease I|eukprot:scaffold85_cov145-Alexandrium_tamarense.AAC.60
MSSSSSYRPPIAILSIQIAILSTSAILLFFGVTRSAVNGLRVQDSSMGNDVDAQDIASAVDFSDNVLSLEHHHGHHSSHSDRGHNKDDVPSQSTDNSFDFYIYTMTYQPEFCRENGDEFVGCQRYEEDWEGQLTIHGLWPEVRYLFD